MEKELYNRASRFFKGIESSPKFREQIKESDQVIQFDPKDGEPFYVQISQGRVDFGKGMRYLLDVEEGLYITGEQESLGSLFKGEMTLAEAIYHHKIQIPGYREKEPLMVEFSKLLRKGIEVYGSDHLL
jgi:hypothetical protein